MTKPEPFVAWSVRIIRGRYRGQIARVVGYDHDGRLSCKFADGTYAMIPETHTRPE